MPKLLGYVRHRGKLSGNGSGMVSVFGGLITTKLNNMCTKEQIQEAKKYLGEQGYGTGSNFTVNAVANLMAEWLAKNCTIPIVNNRTWIVTIECEGDTTDWKITAPNELAAKMTASSNYSGRMIDILRCVEYGC